MRTRENYKDHDAYKYGHWHWLVQLHGRQEPTQLRLNAAPTSATEYSSETPALERRALDLAIRKELEGCSMNWSTPEL